MCNLKRVKSSWILQLFLIKTHGKLLVVPWEEEAHLPCRLRPGWNWVRGLGRNQSGSDDHGRTVLELLKPSPGLGMSSYCGSGHLA